MAELTKQDIKDVLQETLPEVLEPFAKAIQDDIQGVNQEMREGFQRVEERLLKIEESDVYNTKWLQGIDQRLVKVEDKVGIAP